MLIAAANWQDVAIALIAGLPAILSAIFAGLIHQQIKTPSGKSIGQVAEYTHDTAIANNLMLSKHNGPTKPADQATIRREGGTPPLIPDPDAT